MASEGSRSFKMKPTARMIKQTAQFNKIAMDSYFQSKPFPSENEIAHFVKCVKVPEQVVRAFLTARKEAKNSVATTSSGSTLNNLGSRHGSNMKQSFKREEQLDKTRMLKPYPYDSRKFSNIASIRYRLTSKAQILIQFSHQPTARRKSYVQIIKKHATMH